jgi:hypothetical protein
MRRDRDTSKHDIDRYFIFSAKAALLRPDPLIELTRSQDHKCTKNAGRPGYARTRLGGGRSGSANKLPRLPNSSGGGREAAKPCQIDLPPLVSTTSRNLS